MHDFRFQKTSRLLKRDQFEHVYAQGKILHRGSLRIHAIPNGLPHNRLGLSIPRSVGNAVKRNMIKRRFREAFRLLPQTESEGHDLVVTVRFHDHRLMDNYESILLEAIDRFGK